MADDEKRGFYGGGYGYNNNYGGCGGIGNDIISPCEGTDANVLAAGYSPYNGYGFGYGYSCGYFPGYVAGACIDQFFIQNLCQLKGECVKVLLEHSPAIIGRLVQIEVNYISVSVDGTVAYIPFGQIVAIIPIS